MGHELGAHKSVQKYTYRLGLNHKLLKIYEDLIINFKALDFIRSKNELNGLDYKYEAYEKNIKVVDGPTKMQSSCERLYILFSKRCESDFRIYLGMKIVCKYLHIMC